MANVNIRPFRPADLYDLETQPHYAWQVEALMTDPAAVGRLVGPFSWTAFEGERPLACCGIYRGDPVLPGLAWAIVARQVGTCSTMILRAVKTALAAYPGAVLAEIDDTYPPAVRWATLLGFRRVGRWIWLHDRVS